MKSFFVQYLFAPLLIIAGFSSLFLFQNCSSDVGFDTDPSANPANRIGGEPVEEQDAGQGPIVGGNGNIVIQINEQPLDSVDDSTDVLDYEVITTEGSITGVTCVLTNLTTNEEQNLTCGTKDRISVPSTGKGPKQISITATNSQGDSVTEVVNWTIYNKLVPKFKDFTVNISGTKVDIIINVDNSNSMEYEQQSMKNRISAFLSPFKYLDYQISVTTTSPNGGKNSEGVYVWDDSYLDYTEGKFVPMDDSGTYCIKSSVHSDSQAQKLLEDNVVRGLDLLDKLGNPIINPDTGSPYAEGNGWERGIYTTYRAFERVQAGTQGDASCIRDGSVPKHVILISDEDETVAQVDENNQPVHNPAKLLPQSQKSDGGELVRFVSSVFGTDTVFKFHSIIVNPYSSEGAACLQGAGRYTGRRYGQLSMDTGGYIGTVCAEDYATQLGEIGQIISDSTDSQTLECVAATKDGTFGEVVDRDTMNEVTINYSFNRNQVDFDQKPDRGNYRINYYCFE